MTSYIDLGATLFVPNTHKNLTLILKQEKYPNLKSIVIDFEDGIDEDQLTNAKEILKTLIESYEKNSLLVFLRPSDQELLKEFLSYEDIDKVDGFIFPKFSLENADEYLESIKDSKYFFMPSIEGKELFDIEKLKMLRDKLLPYKDRILVVRFGLEDMLRQLGMKRSCEYSLFDYSVCNSVIGNFLAIFKSSGFAISGGVYPCFKDKDGFIKDVKRDLKEGLFSKTIIHPSQIDIVHELYKVSQDELDGARELLRASGAVINISGSMGEVKTMSPYAKEVVARAESYGVL